ncbi:hypothetical protein [Desulfosoma caldarium]|uniref:Sulfotransferase domain-containing protein n=1 Tax=Desulfosoma caldarium TaxID=610254 RepID=A0A3N1UUI2_9BACT|nr:hypothetical protein [Desulfosoma caldarium]ROQ90776.1 hypothetical protein EDC27_2669 [Desulfosoma caldarium]
MQILIHIGTHKTATTFIQNILWLEREALYHFGILYPEAGYFNGAHHKLGDSLINDMDCNVMKKVVNPIFNTIADIPWWQEFVQELHEKRPAKVLISSEEFEWYSRPSDLAKFLASALPGYQIKIAVCLRPQEEYVESLYQEFVRYFKVRETRSLQAALGDMRFADYDILLERWAAAFGWRSLKVTRFDDLKASGLIAGYVDFLELPVSLIPLFEKKQKQAVDVTKKSLPAVCIEFLRLCNMIPLPPNRHNRIVKALYDVSESLVKKYGPNCKRILSPKARLEIRTRFYESNERVRSRFFPKEESLFPRQDEAPLTSTASMQDLIPLLVRQGLI